MSEPKIAVANLPSSTPPTAPKTPPTPPPPATPPAPPTPPDQPTEGRSALAMVAMVGFVVAAVVAGFFIVRAQSLQSDLKQAKDESAQRQTQLEQARTDLVKAQADAKAASEETAKLQTQLEQARSETANAQAATEKASGEAKRLQGQLDQARRELTDAKMNAKKVSDELARLQAQLQAQPNAPSQPKPVAPEVAPAKPMASSKPLPLSVVFGKAAVGDGMAVVLKNTSAAPLKVDVRFTNPTSGTSQDFHLAIDPGASKELGSLGAWLLASGDRIDVTAAGYSPIVKIAP